MRPSTSCDRHGEMRSPASAVPLALMTRSDEMRKSASLLNTASVAPPSDDSVQVWRFANPLHARWSSSMATSEGKLLVNVSVVYGQSLKTRGVKLTPFTVGVDAAAMMGNSKTVRHARLRIEIRLIGAFLLFRGRCETSRIQRGSALLACGVHRGARGRIASPASCRRHVRELRGTTRGLTSGRHPLLR